MLSSVKQAVARVLPRVASCNIRDTIVVAGAPRSGTTWLAEILRELPRYKFLNEPLYLPNSPEARAAGFGWRTYISPDAENDDAREFFGNVLSGRVPHGPRWHYRSDSTMGQIWEQTMGNRLVVKFCRSGRLLRWLCNQFNTRGVVMIIRHPCAVIASQFEHGGWDPDQLQQSVESEEAIGQIPNSVYDQHEGVLDSISSRLEVMTAVWCLDYYIPLVEQSCGERPWELVTYEQLLLNGANEVKRMFSKWGAEQTEAVRGRLDEASAYASQDLAVKDQQKQLSKWRDRLTEKQIDQVLEIVSAFDLDFYSRDVEADYNRLNRL